MSLTPVAAAILAYLLQNGSVGRSVHSLEPMPECGQDPLVPTCELERVCQEPSVVCRAPRWDNHELAWVKVETRETAARRLAVAAEAIDDAAKYLQTCEGAPVSRCEPVPWRKGAADHAYAIASVMFWESGGRRDVALGRPPLGRGLGGEACATQITPETMRRGAIFGLSGAARARRSTEELAGEVLGLDYESQLRCYLAAGWVLGKAEPVARRDCKAGERTDPLFAIYLDGQCVGTSPERQGLVAMRSGTFWSLRKNPQRMPGWFRWALLDS